MTFQLSVCRVPLYGTRLDLNKHLHHSSDDSLWIILMEIPALVGIALRGLLQWPHAQIESMVSAFWQRPRNFIRWPNLSSSTIIPISWYSFGFAQPPAKSIEIESLIGFALQQHKPWQIAKHCRLPDTTDFICCPLQMPRPLWQLDWPQLQFLGGRTPMNLLPPTMGCGAGGVIRFAGKM